MRGVVFAMRPLLMHLFNFVWFRLTVAVVLCLCALIAFIATIMSRFDLGDIFLFLLFGFFGMLQLMRSYVLIHHIRTSRRVVKG